MSAKRAPRLRLPPGLSPEEEAQWWDEHPEYWDTVPTKDELVFLDVTPAKPVNLRLPVHMIEALQRMAELRGIPPKTLMRLWLQQRLDAETKMHVTRSKHRSPRIRTAGP